MKSIWLAELAKHTALKGNTILLRPPEDNETKLKNLEIQFRDGVCCSMICENQHSIAARYEISKGACTQAIIDGEVIRWIEKCQQTFTPLDPITGNRDYEREFTGAVEKHFSRLLSDVSGIQIYRFTK